ncbi:MAG: VIT1/CCC1 transporter family protein [Dehalococcoidia bacterium]|nr:VIT1/CCC1 transporter family protein [Dehalococcoidia bacterium]
MSKQNPADRSRYMRYLQAEQQAVALYTAMAQAEKDPARAQIFRELTEVEGRHLAYWAEKLILDTKDIPPFKPSFRVRALGWMAKSLGTKRVLPLVLRIEGEDTEMYAGDPEATQVMADEEGHSRQLQELRDGKRPGSELDSGGWQKAAGAGAFRAAVLGGNDGLVSTFSLVWGVAGGTSDPAVILLAGVAGLLAGASSMAAGEYVSMRADRDLVEHRIEMERRELQETPGDEREELSLIYRMKGMTKEEANVLADRIIQNPEVALNTMVRDELGLDPTQLGSPWGASISSFFSFALGAVVPVIPYALRLGDRAFLLSGVLSAIALFTVGASLATLTEKGWLRGGLRMLLIGMASALATFGVGRLIGVAVS